MQKLLKEMTIDYTEKGLEWAGNTLDDIFQLSKKPTHNKKGGESHRKQWTTLQLIKKLKEKFMR